VSKLRVTWIKSDIGYAKKQRQTLKALGFHRLNQVVEHNDSESIRGMIAAVNHLVKFEVVNDGTA